MLCRDLMSGGEGVAAGRNAECVSRDCGSYR